MINLSYSKTIPHFTMVYPLGPFYDNSNDTELILETEDRFKQSTGFFGQNNVEHTKVSGNIFAQSFAPDVNQLLDPVKGTYRLPLKFSNGDYNYEESTQGNPFGVYSVELHGSQNHHFEDFDHLNGTYVRTSLYGRSNLAVVVVYKYTWIARFLQDGLMVSRYKVDFSQTRGNRGYPDDFDWTNPSKRQISDVANAASVDSEFSTEIKDGILYTIYGSENWKPSLNISSVKDQLLDEVGLLSNLILPDESELPHFGGLAQLAASKRFAIQENFLESSIELLGLKNLLKSFLKLPKKLKDIPKDASGKYLAAKYGLIPMYSDFMAIIEAIDRVVHTDNLGYRVESATKTATFDDLRIERRVHLALKRISFARSNPLRNLGIAPTPENIWNLIPFSFVVDWFVDISSVLEDVQTHSDFLSLPLAYSMVSQKVTKNIVLDDPVVSGELIFSDYYRKVSHLAPEPNYIGSSLSLPTVHKHWLEAGALIVQTSKNK